MKGQARDTIRLSPNISKTAGGIETPFQRPPVGDGLGELNGHVTDDVTSL